MLEKISAWVFSAGHTRQVDDVADRAILNQMASMVEDLAVRDTPPTPAAVTGKNVDNKQNEKASETVADQTPPVGEEESRVESHPDGDGDPPPRLTAIGGADITKGSGMGGSPEDAGSGEPLVGESSGAPVSSGDNGSEGSAETASTDRAGEREDVR